MGCLVRPFQPFALLTATPSSTKPLPDSALTSVAVPSKEGESEGDNVGRAVSIYDLEEGTKAHLTKRST